MILLGEFKKVVLMIRRCDVRLLAVHAAPGSPGRAIRRCSAGWPAHRPGVNLDAVRNVEKSGDTVRAITQNALSGYTVIDARGLIVAPEFIDLHSHRQKLENDRAHAMDGVTAALDIEDGIVNVDRVDAAQTGKRLIHYGAAVSPVRARRIPHSAGERQRAVEELEVEPRPDGTVIAVLWVPASQAAALSARGTPKVELRATSEWRIRFELQITQRVSQEDEDACSSESGALADCADLRQGVRWAGSV